MKIVNYLDVTFNLNSGSYRHYQKPDNTIQYIHVESNHPLNIVKDTLKASNDFKNKQNVYEGMFFDM